MATEVSFENRKITLPGVYSVVKSGIKNPPISLSYGNVLIIDTGSGAGYGGGAGIVGDLQSGPDTIYPVNNIDDFRKMVKGGYWYTLASPLFEPLKQPGINGASTVYYVRAATTVASIMTFDPVGGGANGGLFEVQTRDEGLIGNGSLVSSELRKGYAFKMSAGVDDPAKFILTFYLGTYTGTAGDGFPYGDIAEASSTPKLIIKSTEFSTIDELAAWANADSIFQEYFKVKTSTEAGDGSIDSTDLTNFSTYQVSVGGTETFDAASFTAVLAAIATLRYTFLFSDAYGDNAQDANNDLLLSHVLDADTSFEKMIFIGGGADSTKWSQANGSIPAAQHFNSDRVVVCHSSVKVSSAITPDRTRTWNTLYTTALVLGRIAGLAPQTPGTFKTLPIIGLSHELTNREKETGLAAGVLMLHLDTQLLTPAYTILQSVNTLQDNSNQVNPDGSTHEISIRRIASQLNLELSINARSELLGGEEGPNLNTVSDRLLVDWTAGQLQFRTAKPTADNLIIAYRNITVETVSDSKFVSYEFKPNGPVNKFFLTGYMVD